MARIIKEDEYAARRNQVLDVAQRLLYSKGYENMTIQDVLDGLQMSKGAFYHYFSSKEALLEAITDRMVEGALAALRPIEVDSSLSALEKLRRYLNTGAQWKTERRELLIPLVRVWYHDDNLAVRQRYFHKTMREVSRFMTEVITQGVREGTMNNPYPDQIGEVIMAVFMDMGETAARFLTEQSSADMRPRIERTFAMYSDTLERILGLAPGAMPLIDRPTMDSWFSTLQAEAAANGAAAAEPELEMA
jgi:AcrR family transcriptional regulator